MTDILQQEQRHIRHRLAVATHVFTTDGITYGQLITIDKDNFVITRHSPVVVGETAQLILTIPGLADKEQQNMELTTECKYCNYVADEELFHIGFHISEISDQNQVALNYFIRDF